MVYSDRCCTTKKRTILISKKKRGYPEPACWCSKANQKPINLAHWWNKCLHVYPVPLIWRGHCKWPEEHSLTPVITPRIQSRPGHFMRAAGGDLFAGLAAWLSSIVEKAMDRLCHTVGYTTSSYGAQWKLKGRLWAERDLCWRISILCVQPTHN